jgi:hypothetical protein
MLSAAVLNKMYIGESACLVQLGLPRVFDESEVMEKASRE